MILIALPAQGGQRFPAILSMSRSFIAGLANVGGRCDAIEIDLDFSRPVGYSLVRQGIPRGMSNSTGITAGFIVISSAWRW
jgi:hypothetical protein